MPGIPVTVGTTTWPSGIRRASRAKLGFATDLRQGQSVKIVIVVIVGYVAGLPAYAWTRHDLRRIHPHLWDAVGMPHPWRQAIALAYLAAGWPVIFVGLAWWLGRTRRQISRVRRRARGPG